MSLEQALDDMPDCGPMDELQDKEMGLCMGERKITISFLFDLTLAANLQ